MRDSWRVAVGTFTALPTRAPADVDSRILGRAMLLAPVTTAPVVVAWVALALLTTHGLLPYAVAAVLAIVVPALLSRALHLDGLADLADGLTSGPDRERSLEVMRRGNTGPAGAATLVLVLGLDAACLAALLTDTLGVALAVAALVASRLAPAICARHGIPAARPDGLGQGVAGTVARPVLIGAVIGLVVVVGLATAGLAVQSAAHAGLAWWTTALIASAVALAGAAGALATRRHAVRRLGGVTGDVIGAAIEIALATGLVVASVLHAAL
jgi:adenosylcobinamide-GDP ribazoletransferase